MKPEVDLQRQAEHMEEKGSTLIWFAVALLLSAIVCLSVAAARALNHGDYRMPLLSSLFLFVISAPPFIVAKLHSIHATVLRIQDESRPNTEA
jgi:ABC-type dipeptide/oligopeptide/nickel transport system permease component